VIDAGRHFAGSGDVGIGPGRVRHATIREDGGSSFKVSDSCCKVSESSFKVSDSLFEIDGSCLVSGGSIPPSVDFARAKDERAR